MPELKLRPPNAESGGQGDVIDFGIGAPLGAGGDGDFKFAREIVEIGIAAEFPVESKDHGRNIGNFVGVEPGEWAAGNVADYIAASAGGAQADGLEAFEHFGEGFDFEPVELDVLANGEVGDAIAMFIGKSGDGAELRAGEQAVGNADAEHEERNGAAFATGAAGDASAIALGVDAPGAEVGGKPFKRDGIETEAGEIADFVEMVPSVFGALKALDTLGFGFVCDGHFLCSGPIGKSAKTKTRVLRG